MQETTYTPESLARHPVALARAMARDLLASRGLAWCLLTRDLEAQYRQSILGVGWAFIPPLALAAMLTLATRGRVVSFGDTAIPYPAYVVVGTVLWQTFVDALHGPTRAVTSARLLLARVSFPREALVLSQVGQTLFHAAVQGTLVAAAIAWYGLPAGGATLLALPALLTLVTLGTLVGLALAPLGALYQDVGRGLAVAASFWFCLTPVAYPPPDAGAFGAIVRLNPVTPLLVTTRELLTGQPLTCPVAFAVVGAASLVGLLTAWVAFRLALPFALERVTA